jgi:hypothetical protein
MDTINIKNNDIISKCDIIINGIPMPNNNLKIIDNSILKIDNYTWQTKIDKEWVTEVKGLEYQISYQDINKKLRIMISYIDDDGYLDIIYIPYYTINNSNIYKLPDAFENEFYNFEIYKENDENIDLNSDWIKSEIRDNLILLSGIPTNIHVGELTFYLKKGDEISKKFNLIINKKFSQNNQKEKKVKMNEEDEISKKVKIIMNEGIKETLVDCLYLFNLKTKQIKNAQDCIAGSALEKVKLTVNQMPKWLNFIDNQDGSALISGIPNINYIGNNTISITASYYDYYDKLDYSIKVIPDKILPVLKEIKEISKITNATKIYYYFNSSKEGKIIYEGNIISDTKYAKLGDNKILLKTPVDYKYSGSIKVKDKNRNISKALNIKSFTVEREKPILVNVHLESDGINPNYAKENDTITLKIKANKNINIPLITIFDKNINVNKINDKEYNASYKITQKSRQGNFKFNITYSDYLKNIGKEVSTVTDNSFVIIELIKPTLNLVSISTSNKQNNFGLINDTISIKIKSDKNIISPDVEIYGNKVNIIELDKTNFIAKYTIKENTNIKNDIFKINYHDFAGNKGIEINKTTDNSIITINNKIK